MKKKINRLLKYVFIHNATDVHFVLDDKKLKTSVRGIKGIIEIQDKLIDESLFHYLKFISNLDLGNTKLPQSGNFQYTYKHHNLYFRFAFLYATNLQSGVLRVLNNHKKFNIEDLSYQDSQIETFQSWTKFRSGLVLVSGPTGSGKSTTLHAILEEIVKSNQLKVITLEDPVEIQSEHYLQLQVNEKIGFGFEEGIKQLLRHDPDVIMIGEVRDELTAKMLVRCALSGHMVFTTIHAKSCKEALKRLQDFGIGDIDLCETMTGITNQRIFSNKQTSERICIYEILEKDELMNVLQGKETSSHYATIYDQIEQAVHEDKITQQEAESDIAFKSK